MPVLFFSEYDQKNILTVFNQDKPKKEIIPLVPRNAHSGWPLLQVSQFIPQGRDRYEQTLGGGKCHFFYIGPFNFACLLAAIPGEMTILAEQDTQSRESLFPSNISTFLAGYHIVHKALGITFASSDGAYGKTLDIKYDFGNAEKLRHVIEHPLTFAIKKGKSLSNFGGYRPTPGYTKQDILDAVDEGVAIFTEGQVYIDLGDLLSRANDPELRDFFKSVFKVDEFLALKEQNKEFTPAAIVDVPEKQKEPENEPSAKLKQPPLQVVTPSKDLSPVKNPALIPIYSKIKIMRDYGATLIKENRAKAEEVTKLAKELEGLLNEFNNKISLKTPQKVEIQSFQEDFTKKLHSKDELMNTHRKVWRPIVANILLALFTAGIGLIAIGIKTGIHAYHCYRNNEKMTVNKCLFFSQTNIEQQIASLDAAAKTIAMT